jgi:hypothetical protein
LASPGTGAVYALRRAASRPVAVALDPVRCRFVILSVVSFAIEPSGVDCAAAGAASTVAPTTADGATVRGRGAVITLLTRTDPLKPIFRTPSEI